MPNVWPCAGACSGEKQLPPVVALAGLDAFDEAAIHQTVGLDDERILPLGPQRRVLLTSRQLDLLGARRGLGWRRGRGRLRVRGICALRVGAAACVSVGACARRGGAGQVPDEQRRADGSSDSQQTSPTR